MSLQGTAVPRLGSPSPIPVLPWEQGLLVGEERTLCVSGFSCVR